MRRTILLLVVVASFLLTPVALAAKGYSADRFDVDVAVQDDGSALVRETVVFRFVGGPFTTVFRELSANETDGIAEISASMDGRTLPAGTGPGQVEIENGRTLKITWRFESTSDAIHTFVLSYRLLGVIRQHSDADVFSYRALPTDHDYRIASSTVRVTYPAGVKLISDPSIVKGSAAVQTNPTQVVFSSSDIGKDHTLQFALRFERGSLISEPPQWQDKQMHDDRFTPYMIGLALLILIGGTLALIIAWRRYPRSAAPAPASALRTMRPPVERAAAIAGMIKDDTGDPQWHYGLATMLDLARRGVLAIEEAPERSWDRQRDFVVRLVSQPSDLLPHEDALLHVLFDSKKGQTDSVKMSSLSDAISARWSIFSKAIQGEMRSAGLFSSEREHVRRRFMIAAAIILVAGLAAFAPAILLLGAVGGSVMIVPIGILLLSCVAFVGAAAFSPLSDAAAKERPAWQSFASYLKDVAKGKELFVGARLMEAYLPYAATTGLAADWAKLFKQRGDEDVMAWFQPLASADGGEGAFVAMVSAGSHAGGSGGAAGGAGAAGGGASGAH